MILTDWKDEDAAETLSNIHDAMLPTGKLFVIDIIDPTTHGFHEAHVMDSF